MKTKKELNAIKEEVETVSKKQHELTDEELTQATGGAYYSGATGKYTIRCSTPGCLFNLDIEPTAWDPTNPICPLCGGTITFDFTPYEE